MAGEERGQSTYPHSPSSSLPCCGSVSDWSYSYSFCQWLLFYKLKTSLGFTNTFPSPSSLNSRDCNGFLLLVPGCSTIACLRFSYIYFKLPLLKKSSGLPYLSWQNPEN